MKITSSQLRRLIQEESRRILREEVETTNTREPPTTEELERQKKLFQTLDTIEDGLYELIQQVRERQRAYGGGYRGPENFGPADATVDLTKVYEAIKTQREIEEMAPDYGGGMFQLPERQ